MSRPADPRVSSPEVTQAAEPESGREAAPASAAQTVPESVGGPSLGRDMRDLARLHVDLARSEMRFGRARFMRGVVLIASSLIVGGLVLGAVGLALFWAWSPRLTPIGAALAVAALYSLVATGLSLLGRRWLRDGESVLMPRTRSLLREIWQWDSADQDRTNS